MRELGRANVRTELLYNGAVIALALGYATDTKEAHGLREEKIRRIGGEG